jgi:hypothetical protein
MRFLPLCLLLTSCSTVIYDGHGNKLAVIRSDARDVTLTKSGNGEITFAASVINNSAPTREALSVVKAGIAAWGAVAAIKHADDTINAFTGNHLKR